MSADLPTDIPAGYEPLFRSSPFLDLVGPFFYRKERDGFSVGLRIAEKHTNARGLAHGGLLVTLADIALGYRMAFSVDPPASLTTVNLSADFSGAAQLGDWVAASVEIQHLGARMAFANAYLTVNDKRVVRISGVFSRGEGRLPGK
jgi:acyl-coenzyme A thioesterase 13